ncbi:MAG TPA: hypothetical protein ENK59_08220 [Thioploca sp.]|nr:hypothetical protein [Thioploca sp.]
MTDEELKELVASLAIAQQKTDKKIDKLIISQQKTDAQLAKTDAQLAKTDAQLAKTDAQLAKTDAQLAKTDAQLAKTDAQLAKTDTKLDKVSAKIEKIAELVGNIANNQGDFAEEFFYRSLINDPNLGQIHFDTIYRNLPANKNKLQDEFDIVLINEKCVAIVEIKQKAHPKLIDDMLARKLPNFRTLFPYYKELKLYGAIASMVSNNKLVDRAKKAGLFFLTQQGNHIVLVNDKAKVF